MFLLFSFSSLSTSFAQDCAESQDCNGHGTNGGIRPCLGCTPNDPKNQKFTKASDWVAVKGSTISGDVAIANNFVIDVPISFSGANVRVAPDARITVNYSATMSSEGSQFYACEGLWEGIKANGTVNLNAGTVIEDAKIGVAFTNLSKPAVVSGVVFKRNMIGIGYQSATAPIKLPQFVFKQFSGNTFECVKRLNKMAQNPKAYRWGTSGITIMGGNLSITRGTGNFFIGKIRTGIEVIDATNVNISGCNFSRIDYTEVSKCDEPLIATDVPHIMTGKPLEDVGRGYGIYAENSKLNVLSCNFIDCAGGGIRTFNTGTDIQKCALHFDGTMNPLNADASLNLTESQLNLDHLIYCEKPGLNTVNVSGNSFFPLWLMTEAAAIYVDQSALKATVHGNNLSFIKIGSPFAAATMTGIHIQGQPYVSTSFRTFVTQNRITMASGLAIKATGILIKEAKKVSIKEKNTLVNYSMSNTADVAGIYLFNSSECEVLDNSVTGDLNNASGHLKTEGIAYFFKGLSATTKFKADKNIIARNKADHIHSGFVFEGSCDASQFYCNEMHNCVYRLKLVKRSTSALEPVIGQQVQTTGLWNQDFYKGVPKLPSGYTFKSRDALHQGKFPDLSLFKYKTPGSEFDPQKVEIAGNKPKSDWFLEEKVRETCGKDPNSVSPSDPDSEISALEEALIRGQFREEQPVWIWEYERELCHKLANKPALRAGYPEREAFYNAKLASSIPAFNTVGKGIEHLLTWSSEAAAQLNSLSLQLEHYVAHYDALFEESETTFGDNPWSAETVAILTGYLQNIDYFQNTIKDKLAQIKQQ